MKRQITDSISENVTDSDLESREDNLLEGIKHIFELRKHKYTYISYAIKHIR